jgi:anaerobic magnesium-protoporphyrin IX monomethyl ester cyclase
MNKPRVILINPAVGDDYEFTRLNRPAPLGLLCLAAMIKNRCEVRLLDQRMDPDFDELLKVELAANPLAIGTHVMGGPQIRIAMNLAQRIKAVTDAPLVWGGAFPTMVPDAVIDFPAVDFVIRGEGETPFAKLIDALADGAPLSEVPSLTFKNSGIIIHNDLAPQPDMNTLPDPLYELPDLRRYDWSAGINHPIDGLKLQMESSRGCSSRCIFCYNPFFYQKTWRSLSAQRTADRFERLVREFGARHIDIIDDSFFEDLERVRQFARILSERKPSVTYLINGGKAGPLLEMPGEDLDLLSKTGCRTILIGAESGSDRVLQKLAKGITAEQIRESNRKLKRHGIQPSYYFICGSPEETEEDLRLTIKTMFGILEDNPAAKIIAAFSFTPFARTPGFKVAQSYGMEEPRTLDEWSRFDTLNTLQPWLDRKQRRRVQILFFLAMFIDRKIKDLSPSPLIRFAAWLYGPIARLRMRKFRLGFNIEERIGRKLISYLSSRNQKKLASVKR